MTDVEQTPQPAAPQNGFDIGNDDEAGKTRPADIEQDMREMERRKRVDVIMNSKMFREELERIVDSAREGGTHGILQHLSDLVGMPNSRLSQAFKSNHCVVPINDIRGVESMGYTKGEKILRCKLASTFRLLDLFNWNQGDLGAQITARLKVDQEIFLVNPYGLMYSEVTASSLNKVDMQGNVVEPGTTNFLVNKNHFSLHSAVHAARPDIRCAIFIGCSPVVAISSLRSGLLPLTKDACVLGEIATFSYTGALLDAEERDRLVRDLGPIAKVLLLSNHGALCCGETIEEAFFAACRIIQACETQLQLLPVGVDNLILIPEETRKIIYEQSRRPPEDLAKKFAANASITEDETDKEAPSTNNKERVVGSAPKWRVGGAEYEALMRALDNAGFRTGYIYRHPLIKSELPKPKNDVELPPAVSSLGYLLEEEEYFRQGIWKKGDLRKGGDRSKWLNSPNVYQKVEVLETGTPDPKKITKWVAEGSPSHSTPVRIEDPLQFVPVGTSSKEFKRLQQKIKDNRRADIISAGPQSHILEGVTWDEANRSLKDGTITSSGDPVVIVGAASKGIIQRGYQHNATVYKTPYAKNPFDHVTDDEINEYTRNVERKKKSVHGEYTDTDFSESEPLSSLQTSGAQKQTTTSTTAQVVSHSEPEDAAHQVLRIQTQQAPVPSQAEVVMSDASFDFINGERSHTATNRKPPTGRADTNMQNNQFQEEEYNDVIDFGTNEEGTPSKQLKIYRDTVERNREIIIEMHNADLFKKQQKKHEQLPVDNENFQFIASDNVNVEDGKLSTGVGAQNNDSDTHISRENINRKPLPLPIAQDPNPLDIIRPISSKTLKRTHAFTVIDEDDTNCCEPYPQSMHANALYDEPEHQRYQVASNCLTPDKCRMIFDSIQRTIDTWSTVSTPCRNTPRNRQGPCSMMNYDGVPFSPYRTVSHFGFNLPLHPVHPDHKHIPDDCNAYPYVPMRRSNSYEEIFSSPAYADLCEHCFARLLRHKPEMLPSRSRINNSLDTKINRYDYVETDRQPFMVSLPLMPRLDEVDECRSIHESIDVVNNTFVEKLESLNYSEESTNIYFEPPLTESVLSAEENGTLVEPEVNEQEKRQRDKVQIISIINLGNWQEQDPILACQYNDPNAMPMNVDNCESDEKVASYETESVDPVEEFASEHTSMSREVRNYRHIEFHELWEEHLGVHRELANGSEELPSSHSHCEDVVDPLDKSLSENLVFDDHHEMADGSEQLPSANAQCEDVVDISLSENLIFAESVIVHNQFSIANPDGSSAKVSQTYELINETDKDISLIRAMEIFEDHYFDDVTEPILQIKVIDDLADNITVEEKSSSTYFDAHNCDMKEVKSENESGNEASKIDLFMSAEETKIISNFINDVTLKMLADAENKEQIAQTEMEVDQQPFDEQNEAIGERNFGGRDASLVTENMDCSVQTSLSMLNWEAITEHVTNGYYNSIRNSDVSDTSFNTIEDKILQTIEDYQLKEKDEIFEKIDYSIRHKLSPDHLLKSVEKNTYEERYDNLTNNVDYVMMEEDDDKPTTSAHARQLLLRRKICTARDILEDAMSVDSEETVSETELQQLGLEYEHERQSDSEDCELMEEEEKLKCPSTVTLSSEDDRMSRTGSFFTANEFLFALKGNCSSPINTKSEPLFGSETHINARKALKSESDKIGTSRDFILENIVKAGLQPHRRSNRKSKPLTAPTNSNVSSIFGKNPFGPITKSNGKIQKNVSKSAKNTMKKRWTRGNDHSSSSQSSSSVAQCDKSPVYSFETEQHMRFWMSMSPRNRKKITPKRKSATKSCSKLEVAKNQFLKPLGLRRKLFNDLANDYESSSVYENNVTFHASNHGKRKGLSDIDNLAKQSRFHETVENYDESNDDSDSEDYKNLTFTNERFQNE